MILFFIVYIFISFITIAILKLKNEKIYALPKLSAGINCIKCFSFKQHKIYIGEAKYFFVEDKLFLSNNDKILTINGIRYFIIIDNYLIFKAGGKVTFNFQFEDYRYFCIKVDAELFNFELEKQRVLREILNSIFEYKANKIFLRFIKVVKNFLKIYIDENKITVSQNKYKIRYTLIYKVFGKTKKLIVNDTSLIKKF